MKSWLAAIALVATTYARAAHADGQWKLVPPPRPLPHGFAAASLADGRVITTGGSDSSGPGPTSAVSLFDPKTDTWSDAAPMIARRTGHAIAPLATGEILVAGGTVSDLLSSSELYDPTTNTWAKLPDLPAATEEARAVRMTDGRIAVLLREPALRVSLALFNPASRTWTTAETPPTGLGYLVPLPLNQLLLMGYTKTVARYRSGSWMPIVVPSGTGLGFPIVLDDGNLFVCGGGSDQPPNLYEWSTSTWPKLPMGAQAYASGVRLSDGRVLLLPSWASRQHDVQIFDSKTRTYSEKMASPEFESAGAIALSDGRALIFTADDAAGGSAYVFTPYVKCSIDAECTTGHCVDGACCDTACNGQCEACDAPGLRGTCVGVEGAPHGARPACSPPWTPACHALTCEPTRSRTECVTPSTPPPCDCTRDEECASGHCSDGVCCDTACDRQCEACDLPGSRGKCSGVVGEPRGLRKQCEVSDSVCGFKQCVGNPTACFYVRNDATECGSVCDGRVLHCDGNGGCGLPGEKDCPDSGCATAGIVERAGRPRLVEALIVVALAAFVDRTRKRRKRVAR